MKKKKILSLLGFFVGFGVAQLIKTNNVYLAALAGAILSSYIILLTYLIIKDV